VLLSWLLPCRCALCGQESPGPRPRPCPACTERLQLPPRGLAGEVPLPWWAAGPYEGNLRRRLLALRQRPEAPALAALVAALEPRLPPAPQRPLLVPVPSWKRQGNPLPPLLSHCLARQLGLVEASLLARAHPVLGQHHLGRRLRFANQRDSFLCRRPPRAGEARRRPLLLVDDILTTGATALAATEALRRSGWRVEGLLCLARTPGSGVGSDLRSPRRHGDRPG